MSMIAKMADPVILGMMSFSIIFLLCIFCGGPLNRLNEQEVKQCLRVEMKTSEEICLRRALQHAFCTTNYI